MNINFSYSSSTDVEKMTGIKEVLIEELFGTIVNYVLRNEEINAIDYIPGGSDGTCEDLEVDLYLCDNKEIQALNKQYRGIDIPTDVLSFTMQEGSDITTFPIVHLGEVIISVDKVFEQAKMNNTSNLKELAFLISHGVLHLLGLTHDTVEDYNKIISIQNEIVEKVTIDLE